MKVATIMPTMMKIMAGLAKLVRFSGGTTGGSMQNWMLAGAQEAAWRGSVAWLWLRRGKGGFASRHQAIFFWNGVDGHFRGVFCENVAEFCGFLLVNSWWNCGH